jgi:hypothetical protein
MLNVRFLDRLAGQPTADLGATQPLLPRGLGVTPTIAEPWIVAWCTERKDSTQSAARTRPSQRATIRFSVSDKQPDRIYVVVASYSAEISMPV